MRHFMSLLAAIVMPFLFGFDHGPVGAASSEAAQRDTECEIGCNNVGAGMNKDHYTFWDLDGTWGGAEGHEDIHWATKSGTCTTTHSSCGFEEEDLEDVDELARLLTSDMRAAFKRIRMMEGKVILNVERQMFQALGCEGRVTANLPLSAEQMLHLTD